MCGIAGIMTRSGVAPDDAALKAMATALAHRGPDGQGRYLSGPVGMVQTRLAIIDLQTGDQPFFADHQEARTGVTERPGANQDARTGTEQVALIANGEIYNYVELKLDMGRVDFQTKSDCEPPLHLYLRHGLDFARHLRGMFALALHDPVENSLVLARDPFGIKPLYYAETEDGLVFASEPQALHRAGLVKPSLNATARNELLQMQFTTGAETMFAGIKRLLPGETAVVRRGRMAERLFHKALPDGGPIQISKADALRRLDDILNDSVGVHQRADVPYGMFLSGGIDSSVLLAMMTRLNERPVQAFTAGFSGTDVPDERAHARAVALATGADHTEVEFSEADFWALLPSVAAVMDDPAADYAILPTYKLAAGASQAGLKVVLTGEGGDELFGGYGRYRRAQRPRWLGGRAMRDNGIFDGLGVLRDPSPNWRDGYAKSEQDAAPETLRGGRTKLQALQAADCADWLPNDLLSKLDRCLMAHGVEGRVPLLDPKVADFALRLPDALKVRHGRGKWLLRKWLETALPAARPFDKKRGFTVPVGEWIAREGKRLGPLVAKQSGIEEICIPGEVEGLFAASGKKAGQAAWSLLFYALWHRRHIMGQAPDGGVFDVLGG